MDDKKYQWDIVQQADELAEKYRELMNELRRVSEGSIDIEVLKAAEEKAYWSATSAHSVCAQISSYGESIKDIESSIKRKVVGLQGKEEKANA